jgi:hypothetical protein
MASPSLKPLLAVTAYLICTVTAVAIDPLLVGTWTTKSAKVLTGPVCFRAATTWIVGSYFMDKQQVLMGDYRASTIQSTTASSSLVLRASPIHSQRTVSTRRHTTERFRIVRFRTGLEIACHGLIDL